MSLLTAVAYVEVVRPMGLSAKPGEDGTDGRLGAKMSK